MKKNKSEPLAKTDFQGNRVESPGFVDFLLLIGKKV